MNREIKFRAFHHTSGMRFFTPDQVDAGAVLFDDGDWRYLRYCEVMQYTGLKDKDGIEIYEGDRYNWRDKEHGTIIEDQGCFWCQADDMDTRCALYVMSEALEVIGNIYEG